jgi:3-isopropylmalate dehydrogenase
MLSFSMMLRYSFDLAEEATLVDNAVKRVLDSGIRTGDIMQQGMKKVTTGEMGDAILKEIEKAA